MILELSQELARRREKETAQRAERRRVERGSSPEQRPILALLEQLTKRSARAA